MSAPCRRNTDDRADSVKLAERFGDVTKADHKVHNKDQQPRLHHDHPVVVQDLATQLIQRYPSKTKSAQEKMRSLRKC